MKTLINVVVLVLFVVSFGFVVGCGDDSSPTAPTAPPPVVTPPTTPTPPPATDPFGPDIRVSNVRKVDGYDLAHWIGFTVTLLNDDYYEYFGGPTGSATYMNIELYWSGNRSSPCRKRIRLREPNRTISLEAMPADCPTSWFGSRQWVAVEFEFFDDRISCEGCTRYRADDLPFAPD